MNSPTIADLYLAWRQAKTALYFERRGVGLVELAQYEADLPARLPQLCDLVSDEKWFDKLEIGEVWIVPKHLNGAADTDEVVRLGTTSNVRSRVLDVQVRLSSSPEFAVAELLYLRRYGPMLDQVVSKNSIGYRLDLRDAALDATRRWIFEYWPRRYQEFRSAPLNEVRAALRRESSSVMIVSADLASFYDSVDPTFLLSEAFLLELRERGIEPVDGYETATMSLLGAYERFRKKASKRLGIPVSTGIPIGSLVSRVVANVSLSTLDAHIEAQPGVLSYRRYVDDLVIVALATDSVTVDGALSDLLPLRQPLQQDEPGAPTELGAPTEFTNDRFVLDVEALNRCGCKFELQRRKTRVHHLAGDPGKDFVDAVQGDFDDTVSRNQAFLDPDTLDGDRLTQLIRARDREGLPLRVLRDADRVRLERFATSTSLRTLERATVLLDAEDTRKLVRATWGRVGRVLTAEDDWVEHLDTALRLLRVAVGTSDWDSARELNMRFDEVFGSVAALRRSAGALRYCGVTIGSQCSAPWTWLRNYLHARRHESVVSSIPGPVSSLEVAMLAPGGLKAHTGAVEPNDLCRQAQALAAADLRTSDREDDRGWPDQDRSISWMEDQLPDLADRFASIKVFLEACDRLKDHAWQMPAARLFLATRPPSYFDVARRLLYTTEGKNGFRNDVFEVLLSVVNALRGTRYNDPVGRVLGKHTVAVPWTEPHDRVQSFVSARRDPRLILGNLVLPEDFWRNAATRVDRHSPGKPVHSLSRLRGLMKVIALATRVAKSRNGRNQTRTPTLLVLPELAVPRRWFRMIANYIVRHGGFGAVMGLEYQHFLSGPFVVNQAFAVLPGPFGAVATWPWTKRSPADGERTALTSLKPSLSFMPLSTDFPPVVVETSWGRFSTLICSELIEARRVADLLGRAELLICPAWNQDTASYDHLIQSVGLQLHAIVAVANNGHFSDCRVWAPRAKAWERSLCRLIDRDEDSIVQVSLPMRSLIEFHESRGSALEASREKSDWRPLPPNWPGRDPSPSSKSFPKDEP